MGECGPDCTHEVEAPSVCIVFTIALIILNKICIPKRPDVIVPIWKNVFHTVRDNDLTTLVMIVSGGISHSSSSRMEMVVTFSVCRPQSYPTSVFTVDRVTRML